MKNLLLTTVLMLAVIFSSNATNDVNGPAKKSIYLWSRGNLPSSLL